MDQIVPLSNAPNQTMTVAVSINGVSLVLTLVIRYNEIVGYWIMDIADSDSNILLSDIPLLTGVWPSANVLAQYQYMNIGSAYVLKNTNDLSRDYPNSLDLGTDFLLLWSDNV